MPFLRKNFILKYNAKIYLKDAIAMFSKISRISVLELEP